MKTSTGPNAFFLPGDSKYYRNNALYQEVLKHSSLESHRVQARLHDRSILSGLSCGLLIFHKNAHGV